RPGVLLAQLLVDRIAFRSIGLWNRPQFRRRSEVGLQVEGSKLAQVVHDIVVHGIGIDPVLWAQARGAAFGSIAEYVGVPGVVAEQLVEGLPIGVRLRNRGRGR